MPYDRPDRSSTILSSSSAIEASGQLNRDFQVVADFLDGLFSRHALGRESHRSGRGRRRTCSSCLAVSPKAGRASRRLGGPCSATSSSQWASLARLAPLEPRPRHDQLVADDQPGDGVDRTVLGAANVDLHLVAGLQRAEADVLHAGAGERLQPLLEVQGRAAPGVGDHFQLDPPRRRPQGRNRKRQEDGQCRNHGQLGESAASWRPPRTTIGVIPHSPKPGQSPPIGIIAQRARVRTAAGRPAPPAPARGRCPSSRPAGDGRSPV